jgi:hypothetical protein
MAKSKPKSGKPKGRTVPVKTQSKFQPRKMKDGGAPKSSGDNTIPRRKPVMIGPNSGEA